jgi:hypothetical protein
MSKFYLFIFLTCLVFHNAESQCSTGGAAWTAGTTNGVMTATGVIAGINMVSARTVGTMSSGRPLYQVSNSTWKGLNYSALEVWRAYSLPGANYTYFKLQIPMDSNSMHLRVDNIRGDLFNWENQRIKGFLNGVPVPIVFKDPVNGAFITGGNTINGASTTTSAVQSAMRAFFTSAVDSIVVQQVSSSDWIIAQLMVECNFILPISLSSFTAADMNNFVRLEWKNSIESDQLLFMEAEQSNDAKQWTMIRTIGSRGAGFPYTVDDTHPAEGVNFYRLKYIYADGRTLYTTILRVNRKSGPFAVTIYPNPARDQVSVSFNADILHAVIYDSEGRKRKILSSRSGTQFVNTSQWNPGIYFIVLEMKNGDILTRKILHQ